MFRYLALFSFLIFGLVAAPAFAQTTSSTGSYYCPVLTHTTARGYTGSNVLELQKFFASYYNVTPTTIETGFFGPITQGYVTQFQESQGLPTVGIAGPLTRAAIAKACGGGTTTPVSSPTSPTPPIACALGALFNSTTGAHCPVTTTPTLPPATSSPPTSPVTGAPSLSLSSVSPNPASIGAKVTLFGSGLESNQNVLILDGKDTLFYDSASAASSNTSFTFTLPSTYVVSGSCTPPTLAANESFACDPVALAITLGTHTLAVQNENGTSNALSFIVATSTAPVTTTLPVATNAPTCNVSAPAEAAANQPITLSWTSTNATSMTGLPAQSLWPPNGSENLTIGSSGVTYHLIFTGPGGQTACSASIMVGTGNMPVTTPIELPNQ